MFNAFSKAENPDSEVFPPLTYSEACFRETEDRQWNLKITGSVPALCGSFLIIHNADRLITTFSIPHGTYTAENPLMLTIPADGITGDYRMIVLGGPRDVMGINLPLSTLKYEVYGYTGFAKSDQRTLWFLAPKDVPELEFKGYAGKVRVVDADGTSLGETVKPLRTGTEGLPASHPSFRDETLKLSLTPGKVYGIQPVDNVYTMGVKPGAYASFDPKRLFLPDPRLREFKWWLDPNLTSSAPSKFTAPLWKPLPPENKK